MREKGKLERGSQMREDLFIEKQIGYGQKTEKEHFDLLVGLLI